jgi:hypothetical protein
MSAISNLADKTNVSRWRAQVRYASASGFNPPVSPNFDAVLPAVNVPTGRTAIISSVSLGAVCNNSLAEKSDMVVRFLNNSGPDTLGRFFTFRVPFDVWTLAATGEQAVNVTYNDLDYICDDGVGIFVRMVANALFTTWDINFAVSGLIVDTAMLRAILTRINTPLV